MMLINAWNHFNTIQENNILKHCPSQKEVRNKTKINSCAEITCRPTNKQNFLISVKCMGYRNNKLTLNFIQVNEFEKVMYYSDDLLVFHMLTYIQGQNQGLVNMIKLCIISKWGINFNLILSQFQWIGKM